LFCVCGEQKPPANNLENLNGGPEILSGNVLIGTMALFLEGLLPAWYW
jgi:hypothetical protein